MVDARTPIHPGDVNPVVRILLDTMYLTIALVTSVLAMAVWIAGLSVSLSLAVFIVGLPVILLTALAFRWTAELDRRNAALVLGRPLRGRYRAQGGGLISRLTTTLRDPQTWKDLAWLVLHSALGLAFGIAAVTLVASAVGLAVLPVWYWSIPEGVEFGLWDVDSLWEAFVTAPLAIPLGLLTALLVRAMAAGHARLAAALLA
jgi:Putative sensor